MVKFVVFLLFFLLLLLLFYEPLKISYNILDDEFLIECLLFGFPGNSNKARLINICTQHAKYVIYALQNKG